MPYSADEDARDYAKKAAKKFKKAKGNLTASQTGARQRAIERAASTEQQNLMDSTSGTADFENYISGATYGRKRPNRTKR